jgi:hypothetical protein
MWQRSRACAHCDSWFATCPLATCPLDCMCSLHMDQHTPVKEPGIKYGTRDDCIITCSAQYVAVAVGCIAVCYVAQDMMSAEQLQKLAELRKQRNNAPQTSSNIVQVCASLQVQLYPVSTHFMLISTVPFAVIMRCLGRALLCMALVSRAHLFLQALCKPKLPVCTSLLITCQTCICSVLCLFHNGLCCLPLLPCCCDCWGGCRVLLMRHSSSHGPHQAR